MFSLFIVLMSFSESLARVAKVSDRTKCLFLNDKPCMHMCSKRNKRR